MTELAPQQMSEHDARRLTERIRIAAVNYSETRGKLMGLVEEAKVGSAHIALGYESWQAYLADTLGDEPMVIARNDGRPEMVRALTEQGMSTRAAAAVMGVSEGTVRNDLSSTAQNYAVDEPRISHGLDGKTRFHQPRPEPVAAPAPKRRPLTDQSNDAGWELAKAVERIERIITDDRFPANRDVINNHLKQHLINSIDKLTTLLNTL